MYQDAFDMGIYVGGRYVLSRYPLKVLLYVFDAIDDS